ncbi:MAG TPA: hypothetical protein VKA73_13640 [Rubrobacter sp.]|nr:hypothetical protein [Rubrobacter sp.]
MADRSTKERKLMALMLNDLASSMSGEDLSQAGQEVGALSDEEIERALASRLDLPYPTDEETLDTALLHVEEPETNSGSPGDMTAAPDMSHEPGPGENRD